MSDYAKTVMSAFLSGADKVVIDEMLPPHHTQLVLSTSTNPASSDWPPSRADQSHPENPGLGIQASVRASAASETPVKTLANDSCGTSREMGASVAASSTGSVPIREMPSESSMSDPQLPETTNNTINNSADIDGAHATEQSANGVTPPVTSIDHSLVVQPAAADLAPLSQNLFRDMFFVMKEEIIKNNTESRFIESVIRREKNELKAIENIEINRIRRELSAHIPQPLPDDLAISATIPLHALPEQAVRLVNAVSASLDAPVDMVVPPLLAAVLTAVRGTFKVRIRDDHVEVLTEYFIASAPPSKKKTPVVDIFRKPLERAENAMKRQTSSSSHELSKEIRAESAKALRNELKAKIHLIQREQGCDTDEAVSQLKSQFDLLDSLVRSRTRMGRQRLFVNRVTPEALGALMEENGEAMSIFTTEGAFLKNLNPDTDELYLQSYVAEGYQYDTKSSGSTQLQAPVLTICLVGQEGVMDSLYKNEQLIDHGLPARFLPLFVPLTSGVHGGVREDIPKDLLDWLERHIATLLRIRPPEGAEGERLFHEIELTPAAKVKFAAYQAALDEEIKRHNQRPSAMPQIGTRLSEALIAFLGKLAGHAIRLAGSVHLLKHSDAQRHEIDEHSMRAGIAFAEFFRKHAEVAFDPGAREGIVYAKKILERIVNDNSITDDFTEREMQQKLTTRVDQINAGLKVLVDHKYLYRYRTTHGKNICIVNPNIKACRARSFLPPPGTAGLYS